MSGAVPAVGAAGAIAIETTRDCTWNAATNVPWITLMSANEGQGSGSLSYRVVANGEPVQRRGSVDINSTSVLIIQDAAPCHFGVSPLNAAVPSTGGAVSIAVETLTGCAWTAASQTSWIAVPQGAGGDRSSAVTLTIPANNGAARSGVATVAGATVTIQQAAAPPPPPPPSPPPTPEPPSPPPPSPSPPTPPPPGPCWFTIAPASVSAPPDGATGSVTVESPSPCTWTATSNAPWLSVTGGAPSAGVGSVSYRVAANSSGAARSGSITIAGQTFTVSQDAPPPPCTYSIAPASQAIDAAGGSGSVAVTATGSSCSWTAVSGVDWVTVTSGASGNGNGAVAFSVATNATGAARTGTMTIAGQAFTVNQAAQ